MAKTGLSRRERDRLRHKKETLAVALRLFSDRDFYNVSMQEIAEESEFSVGTLYNFFESKESLFSALMMSCAHRIYEILMPILEEKTDERQRVCNYIKAHMQIIEDNHIARRQFIQYAAAGVALAAERHQGDATQIRSYNPYCIEKIKKPCTLRRVPRAKSEGKRWLRVEMNLAGLGCSYTTVPHYAHPISEVYLKVKSIIDRKRGF